MVALSLKPAVVCALAFSVCASLLIFRLGVEVVTKSDTTRAGCSSAAVPPACLARGTSCPVYFQGEAMKPDCLRGTGILLHNKLAGSRPACYTLIW